MKPQHESLILAGCCAVVLLMCAAGLGWAVVSGELLTLDGILLTLVCLSMGGVFSLMLFLIARKEGWLGRLLRVGRKAPVEQPADPPPSDQEPK